MKQILSNSKKLYLQVIILMERYLLNENSVKKACELARQYNKMIITGYRNNNKDRALVINQSGKIILERAKTPFNEVLYSPSIVEYNGYALGYLLCVELLQGLIGLEGHSTKLDLITHPIGVGMFSEDQFNEWISEAKKIAVKYNSIIIGTSHADGSYKNCGISIPIAYCIDRTGEPIFISKNDIRSRIVNIETKELTII
jgi:hypothetical protein